MTGDEGWGVTTKWEQTTYIIMSGLSAPQHSFLSFEVIINEFFMMRILFRRHDNGPYAQTAQLL